MSTYDTVTKAHARWNHRSGKGHIMRPGTPNPPIIKLELRCSVCGERVHKLISTARQKDICVRCKQ